MANDRYSGEGLRVKLEAIDGITLSGVLPEPYYFQCPPLDEWSIEHGFNHVTYQTANDGEYSRRGGRNLRTSSWSSLAVDSGIDDRGQPTPGFVILTASIEIEELKASLAELVESGSPFLYTVAHQLPPGGVTNWSRTLAGPEAQWPATLLRFRASEKAGEGDARYFDLDFQEYRDPVVGRKRQGASKFPAFAVLMRDHTARETNTSGKRIGSGSPATWVQLARHYYKDPSQARIIAKANGPMAKIGLNDPIAGYVLVKSDGAVKLRIPAPAKGG